MQTAISHPPWYIKTHLPTSTLYVYIQVNHWLDFQVNDHNQWEDDDVDDDVDDKDEDKDDKR